MVLLFSFSRPLQKLGLLLVLLTAIVGAKKMVDGEIDCKDQKDVSAKALEAAIRSLRDDADSYVCAFNDGGMKKDFPVEFDLSRTDIKMPQNDLRTPSQGYTRAGDCDKPEGNAGIWLQTYRWGAPHFCQKKGEMAAEAQAILDKCSYMNGDDVLVASGTLQHQYEMWVEIGKSNECRDADKPLDEED